MSEEEKKEELNVAKMQLAYIRKAQAATTKEEDFEFMKALGDKLENGIANFETD